MVTLLFAHSRLELEQRRRCGQRKDRASWYEGRGWGGPTRAGRMRSGYVDGLSQRLEVFFSRNANNGHNLHKCAEGFISEIRTMRMTYCHVSEEGLYIIKMGIYQQANTRMLKYCATMGCIRTCRLGLTSGKLQIIKRTRKNELEFYMSTATIIRIFDFPLP